MWNRFAEVYLQPICNLAREGGGWSPPCSSCCTPSTGCWLGLKASPDGTENLTPLRFTPQPTARHYTDYTILAAIHVWMCICVCTSERVNDTMEVRKVCWAIQGWWPKLTYCTISQKNLKQYNGCVAWWISKMYMPLKYSCQVMFHIRCHINVFSLKPAVYCLLYKPMYFLCNITVP